ncbi:MAG: hypothetical protein MJZ94_10575 [Bacteroidales bacterium]|nr:hypothetical protein [Bacteroidales bacterium]
MKKSAFVLLMALFVSATVFAQTKNINMRAKSVTGKQVAIPKAGKNTNAVLSQTTMLVDGKIYPFLAFSFVSCVGDSLTGKVSVTVEATAKNESVMIDFGKNCGENLCLRAVDMKGNLFEGAFAESYDKGKALPVGEAVRYVFEFEKVPVGLDMFHFVKAEYEIRNGEATVSSQECNPIGVKYAKIEWKKL